MEVTAAAIQAAHSEWMDACWKSKNLKIPLNNLLCIHSGCAVAAATIIHILAAAIFVFYILITG